MGTSLEVHYLDLPADVRTGLIDQRDREKDSDVYSFHVTRTVSDFMKSVFPDNASAPHPHVQAGLIEAGMNGQWTENYALIRLAVTVNAHRHRLHTY